MITTKILDNEIWIIPPFENQDAQFAIKEKPNLLLFVQILHPDYYYQNDLLQNLPVAKLD